jgi:hypothetical protein
MRLIPSNKKCETEVTAFQKAEKVEADAVLYLKQIRDCQRPSSLIYLYFHNHLQRKSMFICSKFETPQPPTSLGRQTISHLTK